MNVLGDFKPMELDEGVTKEQRVTEHRALGHRNI